MIIAFTGHRNKTADIHSFDHLDRDALWVHGGAIGFDRQVESYAKAHHVETKIVYPDYDQYGGLAPLIRNEEIIRGADLLIACYDGRHYGGTFHTIDLAKKAGIEIEYWEAQ